jgi:pilus assembly protein Flp/PilA
MLVSGDWTRRVSRADDTPVPEEAQMLAYIRKVTATKREDGASAVEYGLLVAAIAALVVIIVFALGGVIKEVFTDTCEQISSKAGPTATSADCN